MTSYALAIHGGPVTMNPGELSPSEEAAQCRGLARAGGEILHRGGSALELNSRA